ncbi:MAG: transporter, partial [Bacteroidota bacterium]|nr:transporter [Bacteroidota bacterium]
RFELRLEFNFLTTYLHMSSGYKKTTGFNPVALGVRTSLWEEKEWIPKTSLLFHVAIPTIASKSFRANHLAPSFRFAMQNTLTENIGLGYNIGAEWDGFSSAPTWLYTFSPGFNLGEKWYTYIEVFGFITKNQNPVHNIDGGVAYLVNKNIKVDLSGGFGITSIAPKNYVAVGCSFRFMVK